jgi:hypothetical protein
LAGGENASPQPLNITAPASRAAAAKNKRPFKLNGFLSRLILLL